MHPTITVQHNGRWKYTWLKYVQGVNLDHHCIRSLQGPASKKVSTNVLVKGKVRDITATLDEAPANAYYLCGISDPYVWEHNVHVAFTYAEGQTFTVEARGMTVVVQDGERVAIYASAVPASDPHILDREYTTCRNYQFAHWYAAQDWAARTTSVNRLL
jgi:hypothetical protein